MLIIFINNYSDKKNSILLLVLKTAAMENEIWKPIPGYEGCYEISDKGNVKSLERNVLKKNGLISKFYTKILNKYIHKTGYECVVLQKKGIRKSFYVHVLVYDVFMGRKKGETINHKNGIKTDNFLHNLESISMRSNVSHYMKKREGNTSRYIGVFWDKSKNKWCAKIYHSKKHHFLGYFETELDAFNAYKSALSENGLENKYV
jgi:hypothetical protein